MNTTATTTAKTVKVWDIWVRLTHWLVAIGIFVNLTELIEEGSTWHEYVGYAVAALVVSRLIWGFIGTKYARFSDFFPTPRRIKNHLKGFGKQGTHLGHNPFGALMMFALWGVIIALGVTGYLMGLDAYWGEEWLQELHEILANSLYLLIPLHVLSAIGMSFVEKQNLIKAMITGNKIDLSI
ncbi:cytochrome b/b6 domain-containing protein [Moraxella sp. FZLJ2107]|uniref:cytochrome b/b6 domain-containing protein n=1 Tax=unclassified Moraxella TaxID=2685852 RepID=UPI0020C93552|nr:MULTISPECIES: cytochrome b/b6 domain-containing protein [unclassified Moraxella]UTO04372.1 cytochrome b/b6 domain-containing protein [Moraxella sp. FZLJ2107]UTO23205.1 cytochrome b/b6 domain-containing protein [Moraxella sp. FZLJ2109]